MTLYRIIIRNKQNVVVPKGAVVAQADIETDMWSVPQEVLVMKLKAASTIMASKQCRNKLDMRLPEQDFVATVKKARVVFTTVTTTA